MCGSICLWTELNAETIGTVEHFIIQAITVNMWWSHSYFFSVWMRMPVNTFKSRNNWNCWVIETSIDSIQYVVVLSFLFQCVGESANKQILIKKHLEFMSTWSSSYSCQYVVVWFFLYQCVDNNSCHQISKKKQLQLLKIWSLNRFLSICYGIIFSASACVLVWLWTIFN